MSGRAEDEPLAIGQSVGLVSLPVDVSALLDALIDSDAEMLRIIVGSAPTLTFSDSGTTSLDQPPVDEAALAVLEDTFAAFSRTPHDDLCFAFFSHGTADGEHAFEVMVARSETTIIVRSRAPRPTR